MGLFRDSLPAPPVCKDFVPVRSGYSLGQGAICRHLRLSARFSMPSEDTSSVVSVVFMRLLSLFLHPDHTVANPKWFSDWAEGKEYVWNPSEIDIFETQGFNCLS